MNYKTHSYKINLTFDYISLFKFLQIVRISSSYKHCNLLILKYLKKKKSIVTCVSQSLSLSLSLSQHHCFKKSDCLIQSGIKPKIGLVKIGKNLIKIDEKLVNNQEHLGTGPFSGSLTIPIFKTMLNITSLYLVQLCKNKENKHRKLEWGYTWKMKSAHIIKSFSCFLHKK